MGMLTATADQSPPASGWMASAACLNQPLDRFFPASRAEGAADEAKRVCARCDVRDACLEYATVRRIEYGVWGGLDEVERTQRRRRAARRRVGVDRG